MEMPVLGWLNEEDNSDEYSPLPALLFFWEKKAGAGERP